MQRDMDLVRSILLALEAHPNGCAPGRLEFEGYSPEQIGYHVWLMGQAGLIDTYENTTHDDRSPSAVPLCLTWEGYEFIAAAKSESIWRKGTSAIIGKVGAVGFDVLKAVLLAEVRTRVGLPPV